jgi:hypothetical protein
VVAGAADIDGRALDEGFVDVLGAAPAVRLAQHRDAPGRVVRGVAAQRVLADEVFWQLEVDVGTGSPGGQFGPGRVAQVEDDDALCSGLSVGDLQAQGDLVVR